MGFVLKWKRVFISIGVRKILYFERERERERIVGGGVGDRHEGIIQSFVDRDVLL